MAKARQHFLPSLSRISAKSRRTMGAWEAIIPVLTWCFMSEPSIHLEEQREPYVENSFERREIMDL